MLKREMFTRTALSAALRNNVDCITYVLSFISALLFLTCGFISMGGSIGSWSYTQTLSVFSAVGAYASSGGGNAAVAVFLVLFIIIMFVVLISCALLFAVRILTELDVISDVLEVKFASLPISPARVVALINVIISFAAMIMGGVCSLSFSGAYTPMVASFVFSALSVLSNVIIPLVFGKSRRYSVHRVHSAEQPREEYSEHHGWNGTENFDDKDE